MLKQFTKLPRDEDTETRYRRLAGSPPKKAQLNTANATGPVDDHSQWGSFRGEESVTKALMEATLKDALETYQVLSPEEESMLNAAEKTCGIEPGSWLQEIRHGKPATLNWQTLLRRYVGNEIAKSYSYAVPPRRFPHFWALCPEADGAVGRRPFKR